MVGGGGAVDRLGVHFYPIEHHICVVRRNLRVDFVCAVPCNSEQAEVLLVFRHPLQDFSKSALRF
jgi:hypothetical protein